MDWIGCTRRIVTALAVSLAMARAAAGQSAPPAEREKVRLLYEAPESCAGREQFLPQVRARLGTDWEALPGELARTIHVKVSMTGERYVARIELQDARGKQVARAVAGTRCEQVIEGIALVTVLAIQAQLEELISQSEPVSEDSAPPAATAKAPDAAAPTAKEDQKAPASQPAPSSPSEIKLRIGGRGVVQQGMGPEIGTGFGAFAAAVWPHVVLGLAVDSVGTGEVMADVVQAHFNLLAARLDACGRFPLLSTSVTVEPCVFAQAGVLEAQGQTSLPQVTRGSGGTTKWLAPGVLLAVRSELGPVLLGLEASAGVPLDQEQFYLDRGEDDPVVVYQVPGYTTSAALSAGVTF